MKKKSQSKKPRVLTDDEAAEQFLLHCWNIIDYWEKDRTLARGIPYTLRDKLTGVIHSLLVALDGNSMGIPGMEIRPLVPQHDINYLKKEGKNWFPSNVDISGHLADMLYRVAEKHNIRKS